MLRRFLVQTACVLLVVTAQTGFTKELNPKKISKSIVKAWLNDHHDVGVELFRQSGITYNLIHLRDMWYLCDSFLTVRDFREFRSCMDAYEHKYQADLTGGMKQIKKSGYGKDHPRFKMNELETHYHIAIGDYDKAVEFGEATLERGMQGEIGTGMLFPGNTFKQISATNGYGACAYANALAGNRERAVFCTRELLDAKKDFDFYDKKARILAIRSYMALGDYEAALKQLVKVDRKHNNVGKKLVRGLLKPLNLLNSNTFTSINWAAFELSIYEAHALYQTGNPGEAHPLLTSLADDPSLETFGELAVYVLTDLAEIEADRGNLRKASSLYERAVLLLEQHRSTLDLESAKLGFVSDKQGIYLAMVDLLVQLGDVPGAFEYAERAKARALVDMLAAKQDLGATGGTAQREMLSALRAEEQIDRSRYVMSSGTRGLNVVKREIESNEPELASLVSVQSVDVGNIQDRLGDDVLLEYYGGDERLYIFVVSAGGIEVQEVPVRRLGEQVNAFRQALTDASGDQYLTLSRSLYQQLIQPVVSSLRGNVTIVPHGPMHYLPFAALHDGQNYLIDKFSIRMLPSASVINFLRRPRGGEGMLVLGNPDLGDPGYDLPGAEAEARFIGERRPDATLLLRKAASETAIKSSAGAYPILHVASHGVFDSESPLTSGLLLSEDASNDGILTVSELYDMNLDVDLVTLSACETGLGETQSGDDVIGLTRGFFFAGASSLISSLWQVDDDATAQLMQLLYTNLESMDTRQSLRSAQRALRDEFEHPFYWASFQLTGSY